MTQLVPVVMFGWIPLTGVLFWLLGAPRALTVCYVAGWLFLPEAAYDLEGLPEYTKASAISLAALIGALMWAPGKLLGISPRWFDLPAATWCLVPFASCIANGLSLYEGLSMTAYHVLNWGVPYLLGRAYFDNLQAVRTLAVGLVIGGIIYAPLCFFEWRMSPKLHQLVYGFSPGGRIRGDGFISFFGWRPEVFLEHALNVTNYMAAATVLCYCLWARSGLKQLFNVPLGLHLLGLVLILFLSKVLGGFLLLIFGVGAIFLLHKFRTRLPLYALAGMVVLYMVLRISGSWSGEILIDTLSTATTARRAESMQVRLDNEEMLLARALRQPLLGWGIGSRFRVRDDKGRDISITDGFWLIAVGKTGFIGLIAIMGAMLLPVLWAARFPAGIWSVPETAPLLGLSVISALAAINALFNGDVNPLHLLIIGTCLALSSRIAVPAWVPPSRRHIVSARPGGSEPTISTATRRESGTIARGGST